LVPKPASEACSQMLQFVEQLQHCNKNCNILQPFPIPTLLVSIRSALQANWQKPIFSSQCKSYALVSSLEQNLLLRN
jgi:hypothetical protein